MGGKIKHILLERPELVVIRGPSGGGKSTLAQEQFADYLHYEPDHLFCDTQGRYRFDLQLFEQAKSLVLNLADLALARGENVVVSDVFATLAELAPYQELAEAHGAELRVVDCVGSFQNQHNVPLFVLRQQQAAFEPYGGDCGIGPLGPNFARRNRR